MSSKLRLGVLAVMLIVSSLAQAEVWVVALGVDAYEDNAITPLHFAVADAQALVAVYREAGVPDDHLVVLTSDAKERDGLPTKRNLLAALGKVRDKARPEDTLVLFASSHGTQEGAEAYLWTVDTDPEAVATTALPISALSDKLKGLRAQQVLFLIDACRNDPHAGRGDADAQLDDAFAKGVRPKLAANADGPAPKVVTLLACDVGQRAWEIQNEGHGAFTWFLLKGLRGEAKAADGSVHLKDVSAYVQREVAGWAQQRGQQQTPRVEGTDDLVLLTPEQVAGVSHPAASTGDKPGIPAGKGVKLKWRVKLDGTIVSICGGNFSGAGQRLAGAEQVQHTLQVRPVVWAWKDGQFRRSWTGEPYADYRDDGVTVSEFYIRAVTQKDGLDHLYCSSKETFKDGLLRRLDWAGGSFKATDYLYDPDSATDFRSEPFKATNFHSDSLTGVLDSAHADRHLCLATTSGRWAIISNPAGDGEARAIAQSGSKDDDSTFTLADFDGDGQAEVVEVSSDLERRPGLRIYDMADKLKAEVIGAYGFRLTNWKAAGSKYPFIVVRKNEKTPVEGQEGQFKWSGGYVYLIQFNGEGYEEVWKSAKLDDAVLDMQACDPKGEGKDGLVVLSTDAKGCYVSKFVIE